jgi:hypothetical protein
VTHGRWDTEMGGVSIIHICMLSVVQETFCSIHCPQFDIEFGLQPV